MRLAPGAPVGIAVQTFLPYPDFAQSANCLDNRRLGKQRVEALQLVNAILDPTKKGYKHHPCTLMWKPYVPALIRYGVAVCDEWRSRGFNDTVREKLLAMLDPKADPSDPPWLWDPRLHANHRGNLLRKDPEHYGRFGWTEAPTDESYWPGRPNDAR